jgi:hypothetical protein
MLPGSDIDLAARCAPQLMLDSAEPCRPFAFGYTMFRAAGPSPGSRLIAEPAAALTIGTFFELSEHQEPFA